MIEVRLGVYSMEEISPESELKGNPDHVCSVTLQCGVKGVESRPVSSPVWPHY